MLIKITDKDEIKTITTKLSAIDRNRIKSIYKNKYQEIQ